MLDNTNIVRYITLLEVEQTMKAISLKLEDRQVELLDEVSRATHIPKSALVRMGIELVLRQMKEDVISVDLRREIDALLSEDRELLKRLAKA
jgi:predicted DNA-binding protein